MSTTEIKKDIHWVGAIDWSIRDFHGYSTYKGTTYNSFLMIDDKITLFDTVKASKASDMMHNIRSIIDPKKIDYIVMNHIEPDHSSGLPEVIDLIQPEKIICSPMGKKALLEHFHQENWPYEVMETGKSISTGKRTINFLETRMLHWPDSMFSYIPEEKLLISSDAFGEHYASSERFDDEVEFNEWMGHNAKYYANILLLYSPLAQKLLENVKKLNLDIDMIAPDHGLIKRKYVKEILEAYDRWSKYVAKRKAVIVYDTMWHSTEMMAKAVYEGIMKEGGVSAALYDLQVNHRSDIMTEVLESKAVILGSPTLNNGMLPRMAGFLHYMKGLKPQNKIGAAFGSYGWSGEAVKMMTDIMTDMKFELPESGIRFKYVPQHKQLKECVEMGARIAKMIKEQVQE